MAKKANIEVDLDFSPVYEELEDRRSSIADMFYRILREAAPVKTGRLRDSINVKDSEEGIEVDVEADYAAYTNYRTNWFDNAVEEASREAGDIWQK